MNKLNRRIKRYLEEIDKTERKIAELQQYLKGVQSALKQEENNEMIKSIRGMKLSSKELFNLLNGIQDGSVRFQVDRDSEENIPVEESFDEMREREDNNYGEDQEDE
nr:DUF4315 family protein [uncultured Blautia sp.]